MEHSPQETRTRWPGRCFPRRLYPSEKDLPVSDMRECELPIWPDLRR